MGEHGSGEKAIPFRMQTAKCRCGRRTFRDGALLDGERQPRCPVCVEREYEEEPDGE